MHAVCEWQAAALEMEQVKVCGRHCGGAASQRKSVFAVAFALGSAYARKSKRSGRSAGIPFRIPVPRVPPYGHPTALCSKQAARRVLTVFLSF
jgi:hypothetical protein